MSLLVVSRRRLLVPAILLSLSVLPSAATIAAAGKARHTPVVEELVTLLEARPPVREALEGAIRNAGLASLDNTESLLAHLDDLVRPAPPLKTSRTHRCSSYGRVSALRSMRTDAWC